MTMKQTFLLFIIFLSFSGIAVHAAGYEKQDNWYLVKAGDANSFLQALKAANATNTKKDADRVFIYLPNGTYDLGQTVKTVISGHNISIIGQSMDGTIITTKPDRSIEGLGSADMLQVKGTNLYLQDLTLENALDYYGALNGGQSAGRAAVIQDSGDRTIGKNVRMLSHQDTYYSSNVRMQSYWEDCDIHGTVDFICGGGDVRFTNTRISLEPRQSDGKGSRTIVAPKGKVKFGYVFDGCEIVDLANGKGTWNFGRTWNNDPITVYLNTTLDKNAQKTLIKTRWIEKGMNSTDPVLFGEFNTMDTNGKDITPKSNIIKSFGGDFQTILTAEQAAEFSYQKMFSENSEKTWKPANYTRQKEKQQVGDGTSGIFSDSVVYKDGYVSWFGDAYDDIPATYQWALFKNGELAGLILNNYGFQITIDPAKDALTIRGINLMGGLGPEYPVSGTAATKIQRHTHHAQPSTTPVYNLLGMRVSKPNKGIYSINGKKHVVK
jgi:pectin methylesterase-like acyl-CoA thioesterase